MRDALIGLLDKVDAAIARSAGVLGRADVEAVAELARDVRLRLSYPESVVVAALAGGTGSGKSSMLNAVAGAEIAVTGGFRPVTDEPLALVPAVHATALEGYLDDLGIENREARGRYDWLCLIDLPDTDSVALEHRHRVDVLIPRVDLVVWVTDPEKYRDASLHHGYIGPLAAYQAQFVFVLNQVDRVDSGDAARISEDLQKALAEDGIHDPVVILTAADPIAGPPRGIDLLVAAMEQAIRQRPIAYEKALTDLAAAASRLVDASSGARGIEFEERWAAEVGAAVELAIDGHPAGGAHDLASFVSRLATEVGGETGERLDEQAVETHAVFLRCVSEDLPPPVGKGRGSWLRRLAGAESTGEDGSTSIRLVSRVDRAAGDPIRSLLMERGRAHAAITDLALALADLEARSGGGRPGAG